MSGEALCSLGGARTLLDTNLVLVEGPSAREMGGVFMLADRALRPNWLPDIVHEGVHHWCLDSALGAALALNRPSLMEAWVRSDVWELGVRQARHRAVVDSLRPIMEGMACFAEFDAFPGEGNARVEPLAWVDLILGDHYGKVGRQPHGDAEIRDFFAELRIEQEYVGDRKDELFATVLDVASTGGYLAGYLFMKGLQRRLIEALDTAIDTELLLSFVRMFVCFDYPLAEKLLREPGEAFDFRELIRRVQSRLQFLAAAPELAGLVSVYSDALATGVTESDSHEMMLRAGASSAGEYAAYVAEQRHHVDRLETAPDAVDERHAQMIDAVRRFVVRGDRSWVCVAAADVRVAVTDGLVRVDEPDDSTDSIPLYLGPASSMPELREVLHVEDVEGSGSYECWVSARGGAFLVALCRSLPVAAFPLFITDLDRTRTSSSLSACMNRVTRVLLAVLCIGVVAAGCGDDGGASSSIASRPLVEVIPEALAAVEAYYGGTPEYFEVSARLEDVGFIVAVDGATAAEQGSWSPSSGLTEPVPAGEASGATFTARQIDFDADAIFSQLRAELDEPTIVDFAIQGGPNDTVIYDATIASAAGGVLLVMLGPDGSIRGVQGW